MRSATKRENDERLNYIPVKSLFINRLYQIIINTSLL